MTKFNVLEHFKVNQGDIDTFKPSKSSGRLLLYDGDAAAYVHTNGVAKLETALRRFKIDIYEKMFATNCSTARVHLTPRGCKKNNRHLLNSVKPYQGNRTGKAKPPLLEILRSNAVQAFQDDPEIQVLAHHDIEADDGLMIDAFQYDNTCMVSFDKDLRINPFQSYDFDEGKFLSLTDKDTFGWIERKFWNTTSGKASSKMIGKGTKFFWAQMLMGDAADNVQGILKLNGKLCGEAGTYLALDSIRDEHECANLVIDGYRAIGQNVIAEAEAMWLIRNREDSAYRYINSLDLSPQNRQFVEDTNATAWRTADEF